MKKEKISAIVIIIVLLLVVVLIAFSVGYKKDIEVNVLDVSHKNNQFYFNVSLKNNQDEVGWISDVYFSTVQGSTIDLTGAGVAYKIGSGQTVNLTLWSAEVDLGTTEAPFTLTYTVFPSGVAYSVEI